LQQQLLKLNTALLHIIFQSSGGNYHKSLAPLEFKNNTRRMFSEAWNKQRPTENFSLYVVLTFLNRTNLRLNSSPATKSASEIYKMQVLFER